MSYYKIIITLILWLVGHPPMESVSVLWRQLGRTWACSNSFSQWVVPAFFHPLLTRFPKHTLIPRLLFWHWLTKEPKDNDITRLHDVKKNCSVTQRHSSDSRLEKHSSLHVRLLFRFGQRTEKSPAGNLSRRSHKNHSLQSKIRRISKRYQKLTTNHDPFRCKSGNKNIPFFGNTWCIHVITLSLASFWLVVCRTNY